MATPNIEHVVTSQYGTKFFESTRESAEDMLAHGCIFSHLEWPSYTCPGGYPTYYTTKDEGCLCPVCANDNLYLTLDGDDQWRIVDQYINYEDNDLYCDNCWRKIDHAYDMED